MLVQKASSVYDHPKTIDQCFENGLKRSPDWSPRGPRSRHGRSMMVRDHISLVFERRIVRGCGSFVLTTTLAVNLPSLHLSQLTSAFLAGGKSEYYLGFQPFDNDCHCPRRSQQTPHLHAPDRAAVRPDKPQSPRRRPRNRNREIKRCRIRCRVDHAIGMISRQGD